MSTSDSELLRHIRDEAHFLKTVSIGLTHEKIVEDPVLQRAVVRSLEIIGEATKKASESFRLRYPDVEWRKMAGILRS